MSREEALPEESRERPRRWCRTDLLVLFAMAPATALAYVSVLRFGFVSLDDAIYVYRNLSLRAALSFDTLRWLAFSFNPDNWIPVTRLSLLLGYRLFGLRAEYYHAENLLVHIAAGLLLYAFLRRATRNAPASGFVAAVFALHPLHVESVAWVSECKDLLCALFWFATLLAWVRYTERPGVRRYLATLALFSLGLMAKPMIVSLPFLLVLLDVWPLRRGPLRERLTEKLPFLALAGAVMAITVIAQRGAIKPMDTFPLLLRVENALVTVGIYIGDTLWPAKLWADYAYPQGFAAWKTLGAAAGILAASAAAVAQRSRRPWLTTGWFWFLITLIPVIGLVQVGPQGRADRYMYVPMTGLAIIVAWGAAEAAARWPGVRRWAGAAALAACAAMATRTWQQTQFWRDTDTLLRHAIEMDNRDDLALDTLGYTLADQPGRLPEAMEFYRRAKTLRPDIAVYHNNLGYGLYRSNAIEAAIPEFREAVRLDPALTDAWSNLAETLAQTGRQQEGIAAYEAGLRANPQSASLHNKMGAMLWKIPGRSGDALRHFGKAVELQPGYAGARVNLGTVLLNMPGRAEDAVAQFAENVRNEPGSAVAHSNLAGALGRLPGMELEASDQQEEATRLQADIAAKCADIRVPIPEGCN